MIGLALPAAARDVAAAATAESPHPDRRYALVGVRLVDLERAVVSEPSALVIEGACIAAVTEVEALEAGVMRIDARGRYAMPGLVDAHVHLFNTASGRAPNDWALPPFVANGVTAVREMAADAASMKVLATWRREIATGARIGPRIVAAGIPIRARGGDAAAQVDAAADAGADFVKVFSELPAAALPAVIEAAHRRGLAIAGHTPDQLALDAPARRAFATSEHLTQWTRICADAARCRRTARALAATPTAEVPTLVLTRPAFDRGRDRVERDARWPLLRADEQVRWRALVAGEPSLDRAALEPEWRVARRTVRTLVDAGIRVLAGTDAPMPLVYPGWSLHDELALLVAAGLDPAEALRAATTAPLHVLGVEDAGTIAAGRRADLVLLRADPLADIAHTRTIDGVVLAGRWLDRAALDRLASAARD